MHEILVYIQKRPGMYCGSLSPFSWLMGLVDGFDAGYATAVRSSYDSVPVKLVPEAFGYFVNERFPEKGRRAWSDIILDQVKSEQDAFDLFYELLSDFERQRITE